MAPIPSKEIDRAAQLYREALAMGLSPVGMAAPPGELTAVRYVADKMGFGRDAARVRIERALARQPMDQEANSEAGDWQGESAIAEYPEIPSPEPDYEALKAAAKADFRRLQAHKEAVRLIRINVRIEGPYGIMLTGDPHVDNPGTDWPLLDAHTQLIKKTEGLFGANVGDVTDNWVGRLARLYAGSNMSRTRALILAEGWLREVRWLWLDPGNHDLWSGPDDPLQWLTRFAGVHYKWQGSRLELVPPSGASITVNSRHDHPGHSMWHPTHGPLKAASMDGFGDDIYSCGHIHHGGYHLHVHPGGKLSHVLRLSSYKVYDRHKDEHGFKDGHLPAAVFVINPQAPTQAGRVTFYADPYEGADVLTSKRKAFKASKRG